MLLHYTDWNIGESCDDSIANHEKNQTLHHLIHLLLPQFSLFTNNRGNVTLLKDKLKEELLLGHNQFFLYIWGSIVTLK